MPRRGYDLPMPIDKPTPSEIAKAEAFAAQQGTQVVDDEKDLEDLTVPELKDRARAAGIDGASSLKKAELIDALRATA